MYLEKYHGLGNDFLITEDLDYLLNLNKIIDLCNRYTGFGADGFIIVKKDPLEMIFFNQDGTRGEMCGNGIRCFAYYCYVHHLIDGYEFDCLTLDGIKHLTITSIEPFIVKVNMGKMINNFNQYEIEYNGKIYQTYYINFGVPHVVIYDEVNVTNELGKFISNHHLFPNGTNVNFVNVVNEHLLYLKTFERGVGFTKACGTGSCASFIISLNLLKIEKFIEVKQELGSLNIYTVNDNVYMEGPSKKVGKIIIN